MDAAEKLRAFDLAGVLEQLASAVLLIAPEGSVLFANERARSLLGLAPRAGAHLDDLPVRGLAIGERPVTSDVELERPDGSVQTASARATPLRDRGGRLLGSLLVLDGRPLEEELRQAQRLESVGRLAGGIAHEFNNLLQIIGGYSKRLLARAADDESRRELLAIDDATARAAGLVRQLLAFGGRQRLQPRPFDLNLLVDDYEPMLRALLGNDVELHCRLELRLPQIEADSSQLEQVLTNLAMNAREAMHAGGSVTIETASATLDRAAAHLHGLPEGEYVLLKVSDTGVGMDEATRERIFEPFFSTRPPTESRGLGLATVHGIVSQSRGAIAVESAPGEGSTFTIYLPRLQSRVQSLAPAPASAEERRREPAHVLVVEDEPLLLELMTVNLRDAGYRVLPARSPRQALELVRQRPIDLIVTDVVMPELNGPELVDRARELQPTVPALYVSGYAEQAISHGSRLEPLLAKPFDPDDLLAAVAVLLRATPRSQSA